MKLVLFITIFLALKVFGSPHHHYGNDDKNERIRQGLFLYNNEKCLIGLAKVCQLKDFCRDPQDQGMNVVIIGRDKIQGEICPDVGDNIKNINATEDVLEDCRRCSYCDNEGDQRVSYSRSTGIEKKNGQKCCQMKPGILLNTLSELYFKDV